jgi:hypothetical protein
MDHAAARKRGTKKLQKYISVRILLASMEWACCRLVDYLVPVRNRRIATLLPIWDDDQYSPYWDEPCDDDESSCDEDLEHQINDVTDDVIDDDIGLDYDVVWEQGTE